MPTPIGGLAFLVAILGPYVGGELMAGYLIGMGMTLSAFVSLALVFDAAESPTKLLICGSTAIAIPVLFGLFDLYVLIFILLLLAVIWTRGELFSGGE